MYWANFLHIYQPPNQSLEILGKVVTESYRTVLSGLEQNPEAFVTLNINAGLTEMLVENGFGDVVERIAKLAVAGQIELTGTAKYHPFLPKLPEEEIERQIKLNDATNSKFFGEAYKPKGFFPPEMGYEAKVGQVAKRLGFEWIILDEVASPKPLDHTGIYEDKEGLVFFFRERGASFKVLSAQLGTGSVLLRELGQRLSQNEYLLTAMDGETFGHHRPGLEELLVEVYKERKKLPTVTVSKLLSLFSKRILVEPRASTWALMDYDLAANAPYARWDDIDNKIHKLQWELANLAISVVEQEKNEGEARQKLDKALYSDQFWWASARPWWSLEMIEAGANALVAVVKATNCSKQEKDRALDLYVQIITTGFTWQRDGTVRDLSRKEDEEIKARMFEGQAVVTRAEYDRMIATLESQMLSAATAHEYARAEIFKRRIDELTDKRDELPVAQEEVKVNQ